MTHADWLQTLAELSLGLAGFSALIAGFRRDEIGASARNESRGSAVVETSISVLGACVLPVLLHGLGLSETGAFRISGGIFLAGGLPLTVRGFRRAMRSGEASWSSPPPLFSAAGAIGIVGVGASVACLVGRPEPLVPTYYLMALCATLGIGAINFIAFVLTFGETGAPQ